MIPFHQIRGVCLDIDDTLSTHGKLTPQAYQALWNLFNAGFAVVPITGRPAGWCDHIVRFWPVHAVIGENGAFTLLPKAPRLTTPGAPANPTPGLERLRTQIQREFPHAQFASDQKYREYDLAVDFCEDVPAWPMSEVDRLAAFCEKQGAHAKISSIHVNTWFGDYDKWGGFSHYLAQNCPGAPTPLTLDQWVYIGDSPNDEPLFRVFPHSVGVANLKPFLSRIQHPPQWITSASMGDGFVELAQKLLTNS